MARQEKSTNKLNPHTLTDFQNFIFKDEDSNVLDYYRRTLISTRFLFSASDQFAELDIIVSKYDVDYILRQYRQNEEWVASGLEALYRMAKPLSTSVRFQDGSPSKKIVDYLESIKHTIRSIKLESSFGRSPFILTFIDSIYQNLKVLSMWLAYLDIQNLPNLSLQSLHCQDGIFTISNWTKLCQIHVKQVTIHCEPDFIDFDGIQNSVRDLRIGPVSLPKDLIKYVRDISSKFDILQRMQLIFETEDYFETAPVIKNLFENLYSLNQFCEETEFKLEIASYFCYVKLDVVEEVEEELKDVPTEMREMSKLNADITLKEIDEREVTSYYFIYNRKNIAFEIRIDVQNLNEYKYYNYSDSDDSDNDSEDTKENYNSDSNSD